MPAAHSPRADGVDPTERLSPDDMATLREQQFLAAALARQRASRPQRRAQPGVCEICRAVCLPLAVYCDEDCRADHQHRLTVLARQGRGAAHGA